MDKGKPMATPARSRFAHSFASSGLVLVAGACITATVGTVLAGPTGFVGPTLAELAPSLGRPPSTLYRQYCSRCHGEDHKGRGVRERGEYIPDFTETSWHNQREDARLVVSILDGKGTRMPPFRDQLSEAEARALVGHIRQFSPSKKAAVATNSEDFATRFDELEKEFENLRKQFQEISRQPRQP
jgi:hypothetical protein